MAARLERTMIAARSMTMEMAELTRRCDAARGFLPQPLPVPRSRLQHGLLLALGASGALAVLLVLLLFASAILDF
jgi:hypothetical protein